jgi:F-type H+-transporting ATPase subunit gamma
VAQSLTKVKHRISAVESIRKITNSMKLVSSVKLQRMMKISTLQSFYYRAMEQAMTDAIFYNARNTDDYYDTEFIKTFDSTKKLYVLVTSNMGLCGGYNNDIMRYFRNIYKKGDEVIIVGDRGYINLSKEKDLLLDAKFVHLRNDFGIDEVRILTTYLLNKYKTKGYQEIDLIFMKYKNSISFIPSTLKILPIVPKENPSKAYSPIYEPNKKAVIDQIIPQYINSLLYKSIFEAYMSEESSRRNTMDSADKSAMDLVDSLKLEYNKARQTEITQEIIEVVNGSNAVK